jgi:hypothetical protein
MGVPLGRFQVCGGGPGRGTAGKNRKGLRTLQVANRQAGRLCIALNQNSREPVTEPDELLPLWKILHKVGADWTYYSEYCGPEKTIACSWPTTSHWEEIIRAQAEHIDKLGCKVPGQYRMRAFLLCPVWEAD